MLERPLLLLLLLLLLDFGLTQTAVIIIPLVGGFSIFTDDLIKLFSSLLFSSILFFSIAHKKFYVYIWPTSDTRFCTDVNCVVCCICCNVCFDFIYVIEIH